jgi:hypothetical protein
MESRLMLCKNGKVLSSEGWAVQPIGSDFLEYSDGPDALADGLAFPARPMVPGLRPRAFNAPTPP